MTQDETRFFLGEIQAVWRSVDTGPIAVKLWHRQLEHVDLAVAERALDAYMRGVAGDDFPPKPADILRVIVRAAVVVPTEDEAWRMVVSEVRRVGSSMYPTYIDGKPYQLRPGFPVVEVALAVESVGWSHIVDSLGTTKEAGYAQLNFREAYKRVVNRLNEVALVLGVDQIDAWRQQQAASIRSVYLEEPKGLYELGAPEHAAALIDGSGPRAKDIRELAFKSDDVKMLEEPVPEEVKAARRAQVERFIGATPTTRGDAPVSAFQMRRRNG